MSTPAATPAPSDAETFEEMVFALARHDAPTVAFVECGSLAKRNELEARLAERLPEYKFYTIDVTPFPVVSLLHTLNEQLPEAVRTAPPVTYMVHVHGLENSLLVSHDGRIEPSRMTAQLNLERELLFRNVPYIIVLWGDAHFFRTLQREAPDLCHWVTYHFRFTDPEAQPSHALPPLPPERLPQKGNITERQQRIAELTERYERLQLEDSDKKRLLRDKVAILHLLAQEQAECFDFARALNTYQMAIALQETLHDDDILLGELWFNKAGTELDLRRFPEALAGYKKAMSLAAEHNRGNVAHQIGMVYQQQRQWAAALDSYGQALAWKQHMGNKFELGSTYHQIGIVYQQQRQWAAALDSYGQALEWHQRTGNEFSLGNTYHQIGRVHEGQEQWAAALDSYGQALERHHRTGNEFSLGSTYHQIGRVYQQQRQWATALENYKQALEWKQRTGNEFSLGNTYHQIGRVHEDQGQWAAALDSYKQALEWKQRTGNEFELGGTYHQIGMVYQQQQQWAAALDSYGQALEWNQRTGNEFELGGTYHQIGMVYQEQRQWATALENYKQALEWKQRTGNEFSLGNTYHQIGMVHEDQGQWAAAFDSYKQALEWYQCTDNEPELGGTYHQIGWVHEEQEQWAEAAEWFAKAIANLAQYDHPGLPIAQSSLARVQERL